MNYRSLSAVSVAVFVSLLSSISYAVDMPQCSDGIDNDGDSKIDFVCPPPGNNYTPAVSRGRQSASFVGAQGVFEDNAPNGQAKTPSLISSRVRPGDTVKLISVSNDKLSLRLGDATADRACNFGTLSLVNSNNRTLSTVQLRNIGNGVVAPSWTAKAYLSFNDNPAQYSDNSGYANNNGYPPCSVTIEVIAPAVGTPAGSSCVSDPDCTSPDDTTEGGATQCSDGIDNDTDGKVDYPADSGCTSATDATEDNMAAPQCSDGIDNDTDGLKDFPADPGCTSPTDNDETNTPFGNIVFPFCLPACLDGQPCTSACGLTCPANHTKKITANSPTCFLTATPGASSAGTNFVLTGYQNLTWTCTLAGVTTHNVPTTPIIPTAPTTVLSVSTTLSTLAASTTGTFTLPSQVASLLTCPAGNATCSIGGGGVISCGCYDTGITPPATITAAAYTCVSDLCSEGEYYCSVEKTCKPAGESCSTVTCNNNDTCEVGESCNCGDCTNGGEDDADACWLSNGAQMYCTEDTVASSENTEFPFCLPACLDGMPCETTCSLQVGACCPAWKKWNSQENACVGECTKTQAPSQLKVGLDQPYITCTGNGISTNTHFRYRITKQGSTDTPFISDIFTNGTQVLHPSITTIGDYTVQCFYGNATTVETSSSTVADECTKTMTVKDGEDDSIPWCSRIYAYKWLTLSDEMTSPSGFDASFRCGARGLESDLTDPFVIRIGGIPPAYLGYDTGMTEFFKSYGIGAVSLQTNPAHNFTTATPVSCAVRVGDGYSTNNYCRLDACVGNGCNAPQAFSVIQSGDAVCTNEPTDEYTIGCNPDAPEDVRLACIEMFQTALDATKWPATADGVPFRAPLIEKSGMIWAGVGVECVKYAAGKMPGGHNLYDNISCTASLKNGEFYEIYASDSGGDPITSLQTKGRTVQFDDEKPTMEPIKYYTDSSLTTEIQSAEWSRTPVTAVVVCNDTPRGESLSCSCAPNVVSSDTTAIWTTGVHHGDIDIGADLLRYTRQISESMTVSESIKVQDTANNESVAQSIAVSLDTRAPTVTVAETGTGVTKTIRLTANDTGSKIWENRTATAPSQNADGIVYRTGLLADVESLSFDDECDVAPLASNFASVAASSSSRTSATIAIPDVNLTTHVVTYCVRDNAGNTTKGIYPVIADACFAASNMPTIPTLDTYKGLMQTRFALTNLNQKHGYSFSENTTNAACFRGILASNITTLMANQLTPKTGTTLNWSSDRAATKNNAAVLNTNGYYYYTYSSGTNNTLSLTTNPTGDGTKSVVVEGGDIRITRNIDYSGAGKNLVLIARRNGAGNGGNIIIDGSVTRIDAILIADGGVVKSNDITPGERLTINGRIYSYNTRGGSLLLSGTDFVDATTPRRFSANGTLENATTLLDAQTQDLERLRPVFIDGNNTCSVYLNYYAYTTATLPVLLQKPAGYKGGNCGF